MTERTHWSTCWREHHECAITRIKQLEKWKRTVEDEAATSWCLTEKNAGDPKQMLEDIIHTAVTWALDPAISSDAQALIERGRQESKERIAELERENNRLRAKLQLAEMPEWASNAAHISGAMKP